MLDTDLLYEKVKRARIRRSFNNCYSMNLIFKAEQMWEKGDDFIFSYEDHGINRLIYFVSGWDSLDEIIDHMDHGKWFLEYMTKNPDEYIPHSSRFVAKMLRMANPDCTSIFGTSSTVLQYKDAGKTELADVKDAGEITTILWNTFRPEISHLVYTDEMKESIKNGQITIHRTDGHIDALLQADVMPKKFYINQVVNLGERHNVHALLINRLEKYISDGGKYLFAWVEDTNIASIKFHGKYGMKHDGMFSVIYCVER